MMILLDAVSTTTTNPIIFLQILPIIILGIISFFLIRYFKSIDTKLENLSEDMQHTILTTTTIKTELNSWTKILTETKTKLEDFIYEFRGNLERMNDKFEKKSYDINNHVQTNNENIIRIQEREIELNKKIERMQNYQDDFKYNIKK